MLMLSSGPKNDFIMTILKNIGPKNDFIMTILKNIGNEYFFSFVSQRHDFRTKCLIWESVTFNFNKVWIKTITHIYFAVMRLLPINKSVSQFRKQTDQKTQNIKYITVEVELITKFWNSAYKCVIKYLHIKWF